jgi:CheY-like chemotaxis protein
MAEQPRVLVIDDSDIARQSMAAALKGAGCEVFERSSPIGASADIVRNEIQAVVIDMNMPIMSGGRFAELVRQNPRFAKIVLVMVTGDSVEELQELGQRVQADAVLAKKSAAAELVPTVLRLLRGRETVSTAVTGRKVLVIDDDPLVLTMSQARLEKLGFTVVTKKHPSGVLQSLSRELPDIVMLDMQLPAISGEAVAELIRDSPLGGQVGVIFHTAQDKEKAMEVCRRVRALGVVVKSADREAFERQFLELAAKAPKKT